ncbi:MAG: cation transporter, partial [Chloroflexi bacterium]
MQKTTLLVKKMDCPAEVELIRLKFEGCPNIVSCQFDIPDRRVEVYHTGDYKPLLDAINGLQLDASLLETTTAAGQTSAVEQDSDERKLLWQVLAINFGFFVLEILTGFLSGSMGLVADSLDMLADSLVYGLALFAVGGTVARKKNIAKISGYFQLGLAVLGIIEVIRRFLGFGDIPNFQTMIVISILALMGNTASLYLLQKSKNTEAHMKASMIFTANDVIINVGVIIAGVLVFISNSKIPDLVVGTIVFFIVARGAYRILQLA